MTRKPKWWPPKLQPQQPPSPTTVWEKPPPPAEIICCGCMNPVDDAGQTGVNCPHCHPGLR